jgi:hypothetical protein
MSYDTWKTATPDYLDGPDPLDCPACGGDAYPSPDWDGVFVCDCGHEFDSDPYTLDDYLADRADSRISDGE